MNGLLNRYSVKTSIVLQAIIFALVHGINVAPIILLSGIVIGLGVMSLIAVTVIMVHDIKMKLC